MKNALEKVSFLALSLFPKEWNIYLFIPKRVEHLFVSV